MGAGASQSSEESPTSCDGTQKVQVLALARAVANSSPNPYDKEALKFNVRGRLNDENSSNRTRALHDAIVIPNFFFFYRYR